MKAHGTYFYHIPKTAGMSTWQLLEHYYPKEAICPGWMWEDIIELPLDTLAGYDVFRGHFLGYLETYLGRSLNTFTILRDPAERTVSHYCHVLRAPEHPSHLVAQSLTLRAFCVDQRTKHMVQNYQTRCLACLPPKNPTTLAYGMSKADFASYQLQLKLDPRSDEVTPQEESYRAAQQRLKGFVATGLTEYFQDSMALIATALGLPAPPDFPVRNAAPNRLDSIDESTLRTIHDETELDRALYEVVKKDFLERLQARSQAG